MSPDHDDTRYEPPHTSSPTEHLLAELQLYGYRPFQDQPDPRPLPEGNIVAGAVADIFDALVASLADTRLEPDLEELLWSNVNLFHRAIDRIERALDDNEQAQRRSQKEQDGSEIRSVELERLTAEGHTLIERRNSMEFFRDQAADQFERHTHSAWRPRSGSKVNHRTLTSAMIDSRDFLAAKKRASNEVLLPAGPKIAVTGGLDFNDHRLIWDRLDKVYAKHPDMALRIKIRGPPINLSACPAFWGIRQPLGSHLCRGIRETIMPGPIHKHIADSAPSEGQITDYDRAHIAVYLRILDAAAEGANWQEVAEIVLGIDPVAEPKRAKGAHDSHLARARWLTDHGYRHFLTPAQ